MVIIMEFRKYKDRNKRKLYMLIIIGFLLISFGNYLFYKSYALYEEVKNFDVINGSVEDPGDIYFAYYIDGTVSRNMPSQNTGYTLDVEKSNCTNGVKITWNHSTWQGVTDYANYNATSNTRTKCTLYFNKTSKTISTTLGNIEVNSYIPDFTKSACDDSSCGSHEKGVFETTDYDSNPTYYYRGSVENNYVKFAGYYWRILRINSNGSIRIIYDGTSAHGNGAISTDRKVDTSEFNLYNNDNMYVGYMYTSGNAHGTGTSSTVKTNVDKFYAEKLTSYTSKLDANVGFCGDRSALNVIKNDKFGIGSNVSYYSAYYRLIGSRPSLECNYSSDYYTISSSPVGNKALIYPIGLITIDEMMLAGQSGGFSFGFYQTSKVNINNYLTVGFQFWTLTPSGYYVPPDYAYFSSRLLVISAKGYIGDCDPHNKYAIRPVINIRSDVTITGSGTMTDPYVVN